VTIALGMIETLGVPAALEATDAMVKAARVTLVGYENTDFGRITVLIRGPVAEVDRAVTTGIESLKRVNSKEDLLLSWHIIARPHENLEYVLPIYFSHRLDHFCQDISFPPPLSA
jgi:carbon dioxide concentrating mechanism protein CcmK